MKRNLVILLATWQLRVVYATDTVFPLKISNDISRLQGIKTVQNGQVKYDKVVKVFLPAIAKHIEDTFESYDIQKIQLNGGDCEGESLGTYASSLLDSNFHFLYGYEDKPSENYVAFAGICKQSSNSRPLVAYVVMNLAYLALDQDPENEEIFTTLLHEVHHGLGFIDSYNSLFWDRSLKSHRPMADVVQQTNTYLRNKRPEVVNWTKSHFNCNQDIIGVPLENDGDAGSANSHFEQLSLGTEMMNPSSFYNVQYSGATISYIESMGYFKVKEPNTKMEELMIWGKDAGCGPLLDNPVCENIPMTCKATGSICSTDYFSKGDCTTDHSDQNFHNGFGGNCGMFIETLDCRFRNKLGSRCIDVENNGNRVAICGDIVCTGRGETPEKYDVVLKHPLGDVSCTSEEKGQSKSLAGSSPAQSVICPDTSNLCRTGTRCPNDCSYNGRCKIDGTCWCFPSFTGPDCSTVNPTPYQMMVLDPNGGSSTTNLSIFRTLGALSIVITITFIF